MLSAMSTVAMRSCSRCFVALDIGSAAVLFATSRTAVFVGDLIDRGPNQVDTVRTVRSMVDAGSAVMLMGNHEFNALAYATRDPDDPEQFMRPHSDKNRKQHECFLLEVGEDSTLHMELLDWFATLPLWLDLNGLKAIHACWHEASVELLRERLTSGVFDEGLIVEANRCDSEMFKACEVVLKGPEVSLGVREFKDKDGHARSSARVRWWDRSATTLGMWLRYRAVQRRLQTSRSRRSPKSHVPLLRSTSTEIAHLLPSATTGEPVEYGSKVRQRSALISAPSNAGRWSHTDGTGSRS